MFFSFVHSICFQIDIQHVKMHSFDLITTVFERDIGPAHCRTGKHPLFSAWDDYEMKECLVVPNALF